MASKRKGSLPVADRLTELKAKRGQWVAFHGTTQEEGAELREALAAEEGVLVQGSGTAAVAKLP